jgi:hypothetical protein
MKDLKIRDCQKAKVLRLKFHLLPLKKAIMQVIYKCIKLYTIYIIGKTTKYSSSHHSFLRTFHFFFIIHRFY